MTERVREIKKYPSKYFPYENKRKLLHAYMYKKYGNGWAWFQGISQGRSRGSSTYRTPWLDKFRRTEK
jgi:hypothetical protein